MRRGEMAMYVEGAWHTLRPRRAPEEADPIAGLDVSVLQDELLAPILKIIDVRTDKRIDFVGGARGTDTLARAVDSGKAAAAFSLFPVGVPDLMAVSDARGHDAAKEHLVRAEAAGRPADSRDLGQPPRAEGGER